MIKNKLALVIVGMLTLSLVGCGNTSSEFDYVSDMVMENDSSFNGFSMDSGYGAEEMGEMAPAEPEKPIEAEKSNQPSNQISQKLVYTANVDLETKEFDSVLKSIKDTIQGLNGFIEYESYGDNSPWEYYTSSYYEPRAYKNAHIKARIPVEKYEVFLNGLNDTAHIVNKTTQVDNITRNYSNTVIEIESYENQLAVLQDMYNKASTIEEMLKVEARINEVECELTQLNNSLNSMDIDVAYSTVTINLNEVVDYTEIEEPTNTLWDRVKSEFSWSVKNFSNDLESLLMWFIDSVWYLAILLIIILGLRKLKQTRLKNRKTDNSNKTSKTSKTSKISKIKLPHLRKTDKPNTEVANSEKQNTDTDTDTDTVENR